ncbi:hypothetical protein [Brevibacillus sp. SYSU BS000544]
MTLVMDTAATWAWVMTAAADTNTVREKGAENQRLFTLNKKISMHKFSE